MCGAFEQDRDAMHRWNDLLADWPSDLIDHKNIRPTDEVLTLDAEGFSLRKWSLIPRWSKDSKLKYATFNARGETVAEKPAFRDAWKRSQRCIVPASAYFEWPIIDGKKQCHRLSRSDGDAILFGGLWETWQHGEDQRNTFTIITTSAANDIDWVHPRTPLIIDNEHIDHWLTCSPDEAVGLVIPRNDSGLCVTPVSSPKVL
jgi:putative SOS response-associated peptidase YedK